ncbi:MULTISPECIES: HAD family hydrolase [unclassified Paenibacillus]|uniref:HAD family hydrolase n=1 Tax=unclassified Paenibacillus TaxID=185978 RepID=UPI0004F76005|nr:MULTISPECIES: HAD family hydrolase [unclassified Paenibacillus]AIQ29817.1 5'-nucleotidase [Paenibacillus sp. FSL P4-0081]OMF21729.1 phosphoglycolate phosphatase [Paenibacillus sp. FSL H8-0259]
MKDALHHILFDLDGTLTDPKEGITKCVEYALHKLGIEVEHPDLLIPYIGPPLYDSFVQIQGLTHEAALQGVDFYRERYRTLGMFENSVIPGVPELLENLRNQGFSLYVATSKPTVFAEEILRHYKLDHFFRFTAGSNLDGTRSKKREVIQYVLDQNDIPAAQALMIGDREHDIIGAKACGVPSIGVLFGYGSEEELSAAGADYIAATVEETGMIISRISSE